MDSSSYKFSDLMKKYEGFLNPKLELSVDGKKTDSGYMIFDLEIECNVENDAINTAIFRVQNSNNETVKLEEFSLLKDFPLLKKVDIKLGYEEDVKSVFVGYIFERTITLDSENEPELMVTCFCCKAFLRMNTSCTTYKEIPKLSELVKAVLQRYSFASEIDDSENIAKKMTIMQNGTTDFVYICQMAEELGFEFFSHQDKIYFRKPMSVNGEIIKMGPDSIFSLEHKSAMTDIVSKVEIYGYNQDTGQAESASADKVPKKVGTGKTGSELMKGFLAEHIANRYMNGKSSKKMDIAAKTYLQTTSLSLVRLVLSTYGLPEIIPGRFFSMEKMGEDLDNTYYIQAVRHIQKDGYYRTEIKSISNTLAR